ncbi:MAG: hypothetical protein RTV31_05945 [Candidatus Thorarchaeota archaeon]
MPSLFVIDKIRNAEHVSGLISNNKMIESVRTIIPVPTKKNIPLQQLRLEELLAETE